MKIVMPIINNAKELPKFECKPFAKAWQIIPFENVTRKDKKAIATAISGKFMEIIGHGECVCVTPDRLKEIAGKKFLVDGESIKFITINI